MSDKYSYSSQPPRPSSSTNIIYDQTPQKSKKRKKRSKKRDKQTDENSIALQFVDQQPQNEMKNNRVSPENMQNFNLSYQESSFQNFPRNESEVSGSPEPYRPTTYKQHLHPDDAAQNKIADSQRSTTLSNRPTEQRILSKDERILNALAEAETTTLQFFSPRDQRLEQAKKKFQEDLDSKSSKKNYVWIIILIIFLTFILIFQKLLALNAYPNTDFNIYGIYFMLIIPEVPQFIYGILKQIQISSHLTSESTKRSFWVYVQLFFDVVDIISWIILLNFLPKVHPILLISIFNCGNCLPSFVNLVKSLTNFTIIGAIIQFSAVIAEIMKIGLPFILIGSNLIKDKENSNNDSNFSEKPLHQAIAFVIFSLGTSLRHVLIRLENDEIAKEFYVHNNFIALWSSILRIFCASISLIVFVILDIEREASFDDINFGYALLPIFITLAGPLLFTINQIITKLGEKWLYWPNVVTPFLSAVLYFFIQDEKEEPYIYWIVSGLLSSIAVIPYLYVDLTNNLDYNSVDQENNLETYRQITSISNSIPIFNRQIFTIGTGTLDLTSMIIRKSYQSIKDICFQENNKILDAIRSNNPIGGQQIEMKKEEHRMTHYDGIQRLRTTEIDGRTSMRMPSIRMLKQEVRNSVRERLTGFESIPEIQRSSSLSSRASTKSENLSNEQLQLDKKFFDFKTQADTQKILMDQQMAEWIQINEQVDLHLCIFDDKSESAYFNDNTCSCSNSVLCDCRLTNSFAFNSLIQLIKTGNLESQIYSSVTIFCNYNLKISSVTKALNRIDDDVKYKEEYQGKSGRKTGGQHFSFESHYVFVRVKNDKGTKISTTQDSIEPVTNSNNTTPSTSPIKIEIRIANTQKIRINRRYMEAWAINYFFINQYNENCVYLSDPDEQTKKMEEICKKSYFLFADSNSQFDVSAVYNLQRNHLEAEGKLGIIETANSGQSQTNIKNLVKHPKIVTLSSLHYIKSKTLKSLSAYTSPWKLLNYFQQNHINLSEKTMFSELGSLHSLENEALSMIPADLFINNFLETYLREENSPPTEELVYKNHYNDALMGKIIIENNYKINYAVASKIYRKGVEKAEDWINFLANKVFRDLLSRDYLERRFEEFFEESNKRNNQKGVRGGEVKKDSESSQNVVTQGLFSFHFKVDSWLRKIYPALILGLQTSLTYKLIRKKIFLIAVIILLPYAIYLLSVLISTKKSVNSVCFYLTSGWTGLINLLCLTSIISQLFGGCGACNLGSLQFMILFALMFIFIVLQWFYEQAMKIGTVSIWTILLSYFWFLVLCPTLYILMPIYMFFKGKEGSLTKQFQDHERAKYQVGFGNAASLDIFPYRAKYVRRRKNSKKEDEEKKKKEEKQTEHQPTKTISDHIFTKYSFLPCQNQSLFLWTNQADQAGREKEEFAFTWFVTVLVTYMLYFAFCLTGVKTELSTSYICKYNNECKFNVFDRFAEALLLLPFTLNRLVELVVVMKNWVRIWLASHDS